MSDKNQLLHHLTPLGSNQMLRNLTDINAYVLSSKDQERAIRSLLGFCLKHRLASDAIRVFSYMKEMTSLSKDTFKMVTGLLHLLVEAETSTSIKEETIIQVFDFIKGKYLADESAYSIMIKYYCRDRSDMAFDIIKTMKDLVIQPHLRSYRMLIECAKDLSYMNKVYQSLSDDLIAKNSQSEQLNSLIPDKETFLIIFTKLRRFAVEEDKADCFKYYLTEYQKYHMTVDSELSTVIEALVGIYGQAIKREWVNVEENGRVTNLLVEPPSAYNLASIDISSDQSQELLNALSAQNEKTFKAFDKEMASVPYDVVLDGANIALYNNTDFLAWKVIKAVIAYIKKGKRVLIVLSHKRRDAELLKFVAANKGKVSIYWARVGVYDDLIWLYASIKADCPLVTDDKMTDHIFYIFPPFFKMWMERHQVTYDFDKGQLLLYEPSVYSCRIQTFNSHNVWFLPVLNDGSSGVDSASTTSTLNKPADMDKTNSKYKWLMLTFK